MNTLVKNTLLYSISSIIPQAVAFILLPLYSKYLTPAEYGIVNAMVVVQGILAVFFSLGLERAIVRMYWDFPQKEKIFLGTITIAVSILALFILTCSFLLQDVLQKMFNKIDFYPYYVFTIILTFSLTFSLIPKNYYRLKNKAKEYFVLSVLELVFNTTLIIIFLVYYKEGALGVINAKMLAALLLLPIYLYILAKNIEIKFDPSILFDCLKFSLPIIPTLFAAWILGEADRIFIADSLSLHDVGIYSLSKKVAGIIGIVSGAFTMAYHPLFFEMVNNASSDKSKLLKINNLFVIFIVYVSFILAFFSKELISIFLNEKYFSAYYFIPAIALNMLVGSISSAVLGAFFQQSKKMKESMFFGLLGAGITLLFYFILINKIGLWGAILGNLIASLIIFSLLYNYAKMRCYFLPFDWGRISVVFGLSFMLIILFIFFPIQNILISIIIKLLLSILMFIYIFKMNSWDLIFMIKKGKK